MEYKITVITALYNAADTMMAAFDSIRAQSMGFDNIQYIIADDCSTDSSCELADSLAARFPNVSVVKLESNSGSDGPPRNAALPFAAAPYLMFLDSDDKLTPRSCELLYNAIERSGADIVSGDVIESFEGGKNDEGGYIVQFKELSAGVYPLEKPTRELCLSFCFNFRQQLFFHAQIP
ncbi:MAG: glycosyltransferase family 2 protein, partial [Oscillospiraceae bacterium]